MDKIFIVQGDTINEELTITGNLVDEVVGLHLVCPALDIDWKLEPTLLQQNWLLVVEGADTSHLRVGTFKYNLVAYYKGDWKKTVEYAQEIEVLYKDNVWNEAT